MLSKAEPVQTMPALYLPLLASASCIHKNSSYYKYSSHGLRTRCHRFIHILEQKDGKHGFRHTLTSVKRERAWHRGIPALPTTGASPTPRSAPGELPLGLSLCSGVLKLNSRSCCLWSRCPNPGLKTILLFPYQQLNIP